MRLMTYVMLVVCVALCVFAGQFDQYVHSQYLEAGLGGKENTVALTYWYIWLIGLSMGWFACGSIWACLSKCDADGLERHRLAGRDQRIKRNSPQGEMWSGEARAERRKSKRGIIQHGYHDDKDFTA